MASVPHYDIIIIGAGLSGIAAAYHLQTRLPHLRFAMYEARDCLGGTWDLFRYPGVRSDSDMYTLGFSFRPWDRPEAVAEGPDILRYLEETAEAYDITSRVQFSRRVVRSNWGSAEQRWTLDIDDANSGEAVGQVSCNFLWACTGYYRYDAGYTPDFAGIADFEGRVVHPQSWPEDLDYDNQRVVVIGSGATAVTLVPALAERAQHVTMLQRSPTWMFNMPRHDPTEAWLREHLPWKIAYPLVRWRRITLTTLFVQLCLRYPGQLGQWMLDRVAHALGPEASIEDFTPSYKPWKQRVCLVPDDDLFKAIRSGHASVVTDTLERFTPSGLQLTSGEHLDADLVITATGLQAELFSQHRIELDGEPVSLSNHFTYRAMMLSNIPNLAFSVGYTRGGSWTLKVESVCRYICRLLRYMERHGYTEVAPQIDETVAEAQLVDFESGYIERALDRLPRAGAKYPWRVFENYFLDKFALGWSRINDGHLRFS